MPTRFSVDNLEIGAHYTRPELVHLWGHAGHAGISKGVFTPSGGGHIVLFVTREKQASSTQYNDFLNGDCLHWEGEKQHRTDMRIARAHETGEEIHLFYRDVHRTHFTYYGQILLTHFRPNTDRPSEFVFQLAHNLGPSDDLSRMQGQLDRLPPTEREAVVKARLGQGRFREDLFGYWHGCAVTDIQQPALLRASHIKPWRWSSNPERIDPFNGLLLLPHYDHLFDRGYITFDDQGALRTSPAIAKLPPSRLGIDPRAQLKHVAAEHLPYLEYHSENVFIGESGSSD